MLGLVAAHACRLMFKLVNQSACRRFGVVLADKSSGLMESGEHQVCGGGGQREEERCRAGGRHPWQSAAAVPSRPPTGTIPVRRPAEVFAAPPNLPAPGGCPSAVGALCELTHFVTVPEQRRLFINARVVGRFETQQVVSDKPFVTGGQVGGACSCAFAGRAGCRQWCAACLIAAAMARLLLPLG